MRKMLGWLVLELGEKDSLLKVQTARRWTGVNSADMSVLVMN